MHYRAKILRYIMGLLSLVILPIAAALADEEPDYTDEFPLEDCRFKARGQNPYFMLVPGRQLYLTNQACVAEGDCDELEEVWITVTNQVKFITIEVDGKPRTISTRVIQEYETADGELSEISYNYYARCAPSEDVYYFGEEVDNYEDGEITDHDGSWLAGVDDATPGLIMPESAFLIGSRYYQEIAPGIAADRAEHTGTDKEAYVAAGSFDNCIETFETTPLDPDEESEKVYCRGVGLVVDDELELAAYY